MYNQVQKTEYLFSQVNSFLIIHQKQEDTNLFN
jgi:hypothetical protein